MKALETKRGKKALLSKKKLENYFFNPSKLTFVIINSLEQ